MSYCPQCGALLAKDAASCPNCGRVLTPRNAFSEPPSPPRNDNSKTVFAIVGGVVAVAVIAALGFVGYGFITSKDNEKEIELLELQAQQAEERAAKAKEEATQAKIDAMSQEIKHLQDKNKTVSAGKGQVRTVPASEATRCVINGTGVRMRLGPGKQYNYPVDRNGFAYTVRKGTSLPFLGRYGNWYKVRFEGGDYYVSADYAYLIR